MKGTRASHTPGCQSHLPRLARGRGIYVLLGTQQGSLHGYEAIAMHDCPIVPSGTMLKAAWGDLHLPDRSGCYVAKIVYYILTAKEISKHVGKWIAAVDLQPFSSDSGLDVSQ